jgi:hypothetical protein
MDFDNRFIQRTLKKTIGSVEKNRIPVDTAKSIYDAVRGMCTSARVVIEQKKLTQRGRRIKKAA